MCKHKNTITFTGILISAFMFAIISSIFLHNLYEIKTSKNGSKNECLVTLKTSSKIYFVCDEKLYFQYVNYPNDFIENNSYSCWNEKKNSTCVVEKVFDIYNLPLLIFMALIAFLILFSSIAYFVL